MTVLQMRACLMRNTKYSNSSKWKSKVKGMSDNQVIAVYNRFLGTKGMFVR